MNEIKVPYLPIDSFEKSNVVGEFLGAKQEENDQTIKVNQRFTSLKSEGLPESLVLVLHGIGMEKYIELFEKENMSLETLLQMNESDLEELGITNKQDRTAIMQNLGFHKTITENYVVSENHIEDLQIIKNISHHLLLLHYYCMYINLQMRKHKLIDFRLTQKESACTYLKAFVESSLIQTQTLCCRIYDVNSSETLVGKLLKVSVQKSDIQAYDLKSPKALLELVPKKKRKRLKIFNIMVIIGFTSFFVITGKYLIKRW